MAASWPVKPGYRSATRYRIRDGQADAIIRTAAYPPRSKFFQVLHFSIHDHDQVVPMAPPSSAPPSALMRSRNPTKPNIFDRLPAELLYGILECLDMQSLFKLGQTDLKWRQALQEHRPYRVVTRHGRNLFCALLRTELAACISLLDFYRLISTKKCTLCGNFAGFMSILSWTRCCFNCLAHAPETQVRALSSVRRELDLTLADSRRLRTFKVMDTCSRGARTTVVSLHQATLLSKVAHAGQVPLIQVSQRNYRYNLMGACALPYYDKKTDKADGGLQCLGCQQADKRRDVRHSAFQVSEEQVRNQIFSQDEFLEHFRWCDLAQGVWRWSSENI
ncbi:hypothetical protein ACJ41O_009416 [Fusarium nematophilum]